MIYDRTNIQISELCPLQFTEPRSTDFYPAANEYCGKISGSSDLVVQVLVSEDVYNADSMYIKILNANGVEVDRATFNITLLSAGYYYANATITASQFNSIGKNFNGYFEIYYEKTITITPFPPVVELVVTKLADSVWYKINPTFQNDLQEIEYTHEENDYNTVFKHGANTYKFKIWVEGGFIPKDERDEQEVEDFIQQDMVNETVYGDEYVVEPFTLGDSVLGVPNWLRKKFSRISLLDSVKYKQMVNPSRNLVANSLINQTSVAYGFAYRTVDLKKGETYTFSVNGNSAGAAIGAKLFVELSKHDVPFYKSFIIDNDANTTESVTFEAPETGTYGIGSFYYPSGAPAGTVTVNWYQVEEGNIATSYEPLENNNNEQVEYKRVSGAKLEKIEDTKNGLATYKIDLQTPNNYLQ